MNCLAIDYGTKRIGLAYTLNNIIFTLPQIINDKDTFKNLEKIILEFKINKIFVGLSEGKFAQKTLDFISLLRIATVVPIETVEESVSTIEANQISRKNTKKIDSVAAAVILNRAIGYN